MIIVNFSTEHYLNGQRRLSKSLNGHKQLMLTSYTAINSPTHSDSPYAFKLHSIEEALKLDDIVLWADSSLWRVGDLSVIENFIINEGYLLTECGHWVGDWTNQATRDYFQLTDEEAKVPGGFCMFSAGFVGLNKNSTIAMEFFKQWKESEKAGCFRGSHVDHRHDQSAGSIIAERLGMKYKRGGSLLSYVGPGYSKPEAGSIFYLQGIL